MAYLTLEHLSFSYPDAAKAALDDLSLDVDAGAFVVLCGASGCGKTTLLRQLKPALTPAGTRSGEIRLAGRPLAEVSARDAVADIGFILQDPDSQIVLDRVWHELAFGLESLGLPSDEIRLRVAEMASFFGIEEWFGRLTDTLSGGQKQLLNLAAIMAMQPALLLADEPTSQLDPIAAANFLATLRKINDEIGTTVIISEQRLEEVLPLSDRVLVLDAGRLVADAPPAHIGAELRRLGSPFFAALPAPIRLFCALEGTQASATTPAPVTVREGRTYLARREDRQEDRAGRAAGLAAEGPPGCPPARREDRAPVLSLRELWFRYERSRPDVLRGMNLDIYPKELLAIVGGNATGKTTTLGVVAGLLRPYRGRVLRPGLKGAIAVLPQEPRLLFTHKTVREELTAASPDDQRLRDVVEHCELTELLDRHPFDVSGGEAQRIALADVLLTRPRLLLLDEPTKGMDAAFKQRFAALLRRLMATEDLTVVMVSHDIEFCARHADRCALCFDGQITAEGTPREFFSKLSYYTTTARRISRGLLPDAITVSDIVEAVS
ncbi:MAG: ATP-binding cassette domain-containing protein [Actinomycetia bacterium]|nr:ATP-binding cassette domain-containing protein [Actinomycetes bacterium]